MERTDPDLWKAWTDAQAAYRAAAKPTPAGPSAFLTISPNELRRLNEIAERAFLEARKSLWDKLEKEQLVGFGSRNGDVERPTYIYSGGWASLLCGNWEKSILRERGEQGVKIHNIRIYPLVHSPDAASRLAGHSLAQAFRKFVIEDPEVASLGKRIVSGERLHADVFLEGQVPGWFIDFNWPLDLTVRDLAFDFVRPPILIIENPLPQASPLHVQASSAIVDRFLALKRHLVNGNILARGTFERTGMVGAVDPLQWARHGAFIDVRSGDLLINENHKKLPLWTGLTLVDPATFERVQRAASDASVFHVEPTVPLPARPNATQPASSPRASATMESIGQAVQSLWPEGVPKGLPVQKRNQQIIVWQKDNGLAVASTRSIARYFEAS